MVTGNLLVTGSIEGDGSLEVTQKGRVEAHAIVLGGRLGSELAIESKSVIDAGGSLTCGDCVRAGTGIVVGGDLKAGGDVDCKGDVKVKGHADIAIAFDAVNVKIGGDLNSYWLYAKGSVEVGGSITMLEDLRANLSVSAGSYIAVGWRIFAGLIEGRRIRRDEQLIECQDVTAGKIACGELRIRKVGKGKRA